ncbi:TetR/AcrR family transcriptional regulator C-terminal domain-containing protein [Sphaerisporangium viridialbum]|uniref:TetR/AcrR family transcriptional regulator C-terminal domain-containing protein n=1 Tax=Sphaerisporangium viridialbum TaxID=46189 RepID=UPI003C737107
MEEASERVRGPVWARETTKRRSALTREAIVDTAVALADAEGLSAVSIRRVATELGARAMSLYSHIERKEDLLDLMFDQVAGETSFEGGLPAGWREGVLAISRASREAMLRHPWMVDLASRGPKVGPNSLRHAEQSLVALAGLDIDAESKWRILTAADDYTMGHVIREALLYDGPKREGITRYEQDLALRPYLAGLVESGEFPNLAPLLGTGIIGIDDNFERGLKWLLDGISAELSLP